MTPISVKHYSSGAVIADQAFVTESWLERCIGWLGKKQVLPGQGLLITRCSSIHTLGMAFAMDVLFLDKNHKVVKVVCGLKPWRLVWCPFWKAKTVLELPAGTIEKTVIKTGDFLIWKPRP